MNQPALFEPMKPGIPVNRGSVVEIEDELDVCLLTPRGLVGGFLWLSELADVPELPLVLARFWTMNGRTSGMLKRRFRVV